MISFHWNGHQLSAEAGDTVAAALSRNGILAIAATRKRHRPLGYSGSFVQGVLADVDGIPNVRLDRELVRAGIRVRVQNVWPGPRLDALKAFRLLPERWVRGGFEHPRLLPGGTARFERWERLMSFLAGEGTLSPKFPGQAVVPGERREADAVVVGGGPPGIAEANALAARGRKVVLIARQMRAAGPNGAGNASALPVSVEVLDRHEAFGIYRQGRLVAAAPFDSTRPAIVIETDELILATGKRSCPPVVPGNALPGVMDAATARELIERRGIDIGRIVIVGTGAEAVLAETLRKAGATVAAVAPVANLQRIVGQGAVRAADIGRRVACEAVVHAGPWISDPNLAFQAAADGELRLGAHPLPDHVRRIGRVAEPDEPVHVGALAEARLASVCPCMDVMGAEILDLLDDGMTHIEELKRQTACGMGPCQGFPCWEILRALLAKATNGTLGSDRPSHRPPRRALTVAQAAGLAGLVEPQR